MMDNPIEDLPFTVRIVKSLEDLQKVAALRYQAYLRHIPEFANQLITAEAADTDPNTLVLLVESKPQYNCGGDSVRNNADSH